MFAGSDRQRKTTDHEVKRSSMSTINVALAYPNTFQLGMGNLGYQFVYGYLNSLSEFSAERVFYSESPGRQGPTSEETGRPLRDFDVVAFSIPFENDYPSVPAMLESAGIPPLREHRTDNDPLILAGGVSVSMNPEPLSSFLDLVFIGEMGETEASDRFCAALRETIARPRTRSGSGDWALQAFSTVPGAYVPAAYSFSYDDEGFIREVRVQDGFPKRVKAVKRRSREAPVPVSVLFTPEAEFADSLLVETNRGCGRGCRFCAGGWIHFPVRHADFSGFRSSVEKAVLEGRTVGLIGSDLAGHPQLEEILTFIVEQNGKFSLSSIRPEGLTPRIVALLARTGQKTATLAPEAASPRMKRVIGKEIPSERFLELVEQLVAVGIPNIRFYFMVGLPTETDEDAEDVARFVEQARKIFVEASRSRRSIGRIGVQVTPFVPKPWTPFQWAAMASQKTLQQRVRIIRERLKRMGNVVVRVESVREATGQGLLSRGDRNVWHAIVEVARQQGRWTPVLREHPELLDWYVHRERETGEIFPWEVTDHGLTRKVLERSYQRGMAASREEE